MTAAMIEVRNASKFFGDLVAVSDVTFDVGPGVTALLGPNGAGKSTVLRMLCGLAAPSRGTVRVLGDDPRANVDRFRDIALVPQQESVFDHMSALEFVHAAAALGRVDEPTAAARRCLHIVELDPDEPRKLPTYSKGMRQRVKLAQALVGDPAVIMLDEPLTGLDPRQRLQMVDLFHRLGAEGRCVLVSSHVLEEVERFGSNVLVIAEGRLAATGDFREIRALMDDRPLQLRVRATNARRLAAGLMVSDAVAGVRLEDAETMIVDASDAGSLSRAIATVARDTDASLFEVQSLDDDLESTFKYLVERR